MPTYEYLCRNEECGHEFETFQSMKDEALTLCPECQQSTLKRKIGLGAGIIFKGSGFYETDYKRKSNDSNASAQSSDSKSSDGKKSEAASSKKDTKTPASKKD